MQGVFTRQNYACPFLLGRGVLGTGWTAKRCLNLGTWGVNALGEICQVCFALVV
eukprot:c37194_g1_i1 orf=392-553(+)